jgi:phosphate uptake regulator
LELRKLQLVGWSSFSVTLPPDWIKENNLKPSDQITITREDDGSLRLVPGIIQEEKKEVKITIDADRCKNPGLLIKLIVGAYIRGSDLIEVVSKHTISENHGREIRNAVDGVIGVGIVESTSNQVKLQAMIDPSKFPIRPLLKRLFELSLSMYKDALQSLKDKDSSLAASVIRRENEVNKIYWLVGRQIASSAFDKTFLKKIELKGTPDLALQMAISPRIWEVSNYAVDIADNLLAIGQKEVSDADLQKVFRLGKMAQEIISNAFEAFFKGDVILANNTMESFKALDKRKDELVKDVVPRIKDGDVLTSLMNIIRDLRGIARYGKSIAEITIYNSSAEKNNLP